MATSTEHHRERRARSAARGVVCVHTTHAAAHGEIVNVSIGGALLALESACGARLGGAVALDLKLACDARWHRVTARVVRNDKPRHLLAVMFDAIDADLEDAIGDLVLQAVEASARPRVLLVEHDDTARARHARVLRRSGCHVLEARTPLEAVAICEGSAIPVAGAVVVDHSTSVGADALAAFLAQAYVGTDTTHIDSASRNVSDALFVAARAARRRALLT